MSPFWDKVHKCDHEFVSPNYYVNIKCPTPYCKGYEVRCRD